MNAAAAIRLISYEQSYAANRRARAFYAKPGFQIVDRGSDNEERLPHLLLEWHNRHSTGG